MKKSTTLKFTLPKGLADKIEEQASSSFMSKAHVVRDAVRKYFSKVKPHSRGSK